MSIRIKALNPDSESEINQLCSLYSRAYGPYLQITPVNDARFWKARVGNRFITIVVMQDSRLVASVSFRPDRENQKNIQLYLAVCDPEALGQASEIRSAIADLMHRLSLRQGWEMVYAYQYLLMPEQAKFTHMLVDGVDVAFWPASITKESKDSSKHKHREFPNLGPVLVSQRLLNPETNKNAHAELLFVPREHEEICQSLYGELNSKFDLASNCRVTAKKKISEQEQVHALSADHRAIERHPHKQAGFSLYYIEPSLVGKFRNLELSLSKPARSADYVALNMADPKTPEFCEQLSELGFGFSGILPYYRNKHFILYYKTNSAFDWVSLQNESKLSEYLKVIHEAPAKAASKSKKSDEAVRR